MSSTTISKVMRLIDYNQVIPLPEESSQRLRGGSPQFSSLPSLPFVLEMHNNPLGIDWTLTLKPTAQQ